jgi:hypothetical protein
MHQFVHKSDSRVFAVVTGDPEIFASHMCHAHDSRQRPIPIGYLGPRDTVAFILRYSALYPYPFSHSQMTGPGHETVLARTSASNTLGS